MYRFDCFDSFDKDHCVSDAATVRYCFDSFDEDHCVMLPQWSSSKLSKQSKRYITVAASQQSSSKLSKQSKQQITVIASLTAVFIKTIKTVKTFKMIHNCVMLLQLSIVLTDSFDEDCCVMLPQTVKTSDSITQ